MLRFASLGSGSKGNATLIESGSGASDTRILLDCGFSAVQVEARLARLGRDPSSITAIVLTHEHSDHVVGAGIFSRKYKIPVWLTIGTYLACKDNKFFSVSYIDSHLVFEIEDIQLFPFPVPHDAREPCQFVFSDGQSRLGIVTDFGEVTPHVVNCLKGLDSLLLECNYDQEMLEQGSYPKTLKQRVLSRVGHLENNQAMELLKVVGLSKIKHLIGMHVSENNNQPSLAVNALSKGIGCSKKEVLLASQAVGFDWRELP